MSRAASGMHRELLARALRQSVGDEVVRVVDQVADEPVGKAAVERDRVSVSLVEVVAGTACASAVTPLDAG